MGERRFYRMHVRGFDDALGPGVPEGHVVLLVGPPGTMKSSLAYHVLYENAKRDGVRGAYVTLEQGRESLEFQMARMGMPLAAVGEKLRVEDLARIRLGLEPDPGEGEKPWLDVLQRHLEGLKDSAKLQLLALDSLPVLEIIGGVKEKRVRLFRFFGWLRGLGVTTLLVSEATHDPNLVRDEEFLADGVISLTMEKVGDLDVYRRIRCVKMRGVAHDTNVYTLEFDASGFRATQAI
ncbi:MAG TPA: ATPase domain-containing protein [Thermoplasmata archaeon]|nr:ATPase domain-containing protein [Thermoplasmata archaeon]